MNLDYQRAGRVLPFPFHFLNNNHAMNVRPKNYTWTEFYDGLIDVTSYSFSWRAIARRIPATPTAIPKWMNFVRAVSSEGFGRIRYHTTIRKLLDTDPSVRAYLEGETDVLPEFYRRGSGQSSGRCTICCRRVRSSTTRMPICRRCTEEPELVPVVMRTAAGRLRTQSVDQAGAHVDPRADPLLAATKLEVLLRHEPLALAASPARSGARAAAAGRWPTPASRRPAEPLDTATHTPGGAGPRGSSRARCSPI